MANEKEIVRISKFLSLVLRHKPETIGLTLDENGWAITNDLLQKMNRHHFQLTPEILADVVATNSKKRFTFNEDQSKIRASQGHSLQVELNLQQQSPPSYLYHGTGEKSVDSILATGLEKRNRQHVHLSKDIETAIAVGKRHGKPIVFQIATSQMITDGFAFYLSENEVWLTDHVPVVYIQRIDLPL